MAERDHVEIEGVWRNIVSLNEQIERSLGLPRTIVRNRLDLEVQRARIHKKLDRRQRIQDERDGLTDPDGD